jgi:hypothetical protein
VGDRAVPNEALRVLLAEAGWSGAELARRVSKVAAEAGLALVLDRRSVSFWLAGRCPRAPMPELVAEALSRGLDRPVDVDSVGMGRQDPGAAAGGLRHSGTRHSGMRTHTGGSRPAAELGDPVTSLSRLAQAHGRRQVLAGGAYSLSLLAVPSWTQAAAAGSRLARGVSERYRLRRWSWAGEPPPFDERAF